MHISASEVDMTCALHISASDPKAGQILIHRKVATAKN
jgi:hypothetical protein